MVRDDNNDQDEFINDNEEETEYTQTQITTETIETTNTVVGFMADQIETNLGKVTAKLPELNNQIEAVTEMKTAYVASGNEITYNIEIKNNGKENLEKINVSTLIPEGTELVEDSISDNGVYENGKISWKVDVDDVKQVSFKLKVIKTSGKIELSAIVDGKETNMVTNIIDEAPIVKLNGDKEITLEAGIDKYEELGATVTDNVDEKIEELQPVLIHYYTYNKETKKYEFSKKVESVDTSKVGMLYWTQFFGHLCY